MTYDPFPQDPNPYPVIPQSNAGSALLYLQASGLERALADSEAERLLGIHAELIKAQWDPYAISYNNLPYLAYAMGVNLWEGDYWAEGAKRDWVALQWEFKHVRGAPKAYRMALGMSGYTVTDMVRPPQGFYASPELTKDEWDFWIRQMPELRFFFAHRQGTRGIDEIFVDNDNAARIWAGGPTIPDHWLPTNVPPALNSTAGINTDVVAAGTGFADADAVSIDDGRVLRGRDAVLRQNGVVQDIYQVIYDPVSLVSDVVDYERVSIPGLSTMGLFADEVIADDSADVALVDAEETEPRLFTVRLDRNYVHDMSQLALTTLTPSFAPITPRYERFSDAGNGNGFFFENDFAEETNPAHAGEFVDETDGGEYLMGDSLFLFDPSVQEPMMQGISFADYSRVGMPSYTAEIQVDLHTVENAPSWISETSFADDSYAVPQDNSHIDRAIRAILASKALRDTILVSFAPKRPAQVGDYLPPDAAYDVWVDDPL